MSIPHIKNHFLGSGWDHYTRTFQGIGRRRAWSGLHYSALSRRVLREHYHIFWRWFNFYYPTRDARWGGKPLDYRALLCGCTGWVRSIRSSSDWASRSPERVRIAYLVCFACLCYFLLHLYFLFISPFCFPRNNKKSISLLSLSSMNFVFPLPIIH